MIISLEEAKKVNPDLQIADILALEAAIRAHTNNHFHRQDYEPRVTKMIGKKVFIDGLNLFDENDTVELYGTKFFDGFYTVKESGDDYVLLDIPGKVPEQEIELYNAKLYQIIYPPELMVGAKNVFKHKLEMGQKTGIKSETVARVSITYASPQDGAGSIYGLPSYVFDFCAPYMKLGWS